MSWIANIACGVAEHGAVVRVTVIRADGSTPRETGAAMLIGAAHITDTIGGGALELEAIAHARGMLATSPSPRASPTFLAPAPARWQRDVRDFALGPSLGQCCGGYTRLLFELFTGRERRALEDLARHTDADAALVLRPLDSGAPLETVATRKDPTERPLAVTRAVRDMLSGARPREAVLIRGGKGASAWFVEPLARRMVPLIVYGAGHVGRALVRVLQDLPFAVTWADTAASRFPGPLPPSVCAQATPDLPGLASVAPTGAWHIVMTYSHALDLAICHAVLRRGDFGHLGLIGSATKRARFLKRLSELGIAPATLARLTCPIGMPGLGGKEPSMIAVSVAAQLVRLATASRAELAGVISLASEDGGR
jgi:xanthine dehydrogenase accessory factor